MGFHLEYLHLTLTHSKGQDKSHANFGHSLFPKYSLSKCTWLSEWVKANRKPIPDLLFDSINNFYTIGHGLQDNRIRTFGTLSNRIWPKNRRSRSWSVLYHHTIIWLISWLRICWKMRVYLKQFGCGSPSNRTYIPYISAPPCWR